MYLLRCLQPWDGSYHMRRKTGENFSLKCRFVPVVGHCGQVNYFTFMLLILRGSRRLLADVFSSTKRRVDANSSCDNRSYQVIFQLTYGPTFQDVINTLPVHRDDDDRCRNDSELACRTRRKRSGIANGVPAEQWVYGQRRKLTQSRQEQSPLAADSVWTCQRTLEVERRGWSNAVMNHCRCCCSAHRTDFAWRAA